MAAFLKLNDVIVPKETFWRAPPPHRKCQTKKTVFTSPKDDFRRSNGKKQFPRRLRERCSLKEKLNSVRVLFHSSGID